MAMQDRPRLDKSMVEVGGANAAKEESQYVKVVFFLNHASHCRSG